LLTIGAAGISKQDKQIKGLVPLKKREEKKNTLVSVTPTILSTLLNYYRVRDPGIAEKLPLSDMK